MCVIKKILLFALMAIPYSVYAQSEEIMSVGLTAAQTTVSTGTNTETTTVKFGYLSYSKMLQAMPDYTIAHKQYLQLEAKYADEAKRVEEEFNAKYEVFLEGQRDFPPTILKKRQTELQDLLEKNIAFKTESKRLLANAETALMKPLRDKLSKVLETIGEEMDLMFILNTDGDNCPFINPKQGIDISDIASKMLNEL